MQKKILAVSDDADKTIWQVNGLAVGNYRIIGADELGWHYLDVVAVSNVAANPAPIEIALPKHFTKIELLIDRRKEMKQARP